MRDEITHISRAALSALTLEAGTRLEVLRGEVWLTEEGVAQDFVLRAGDSHQVHKSGRVLMDAAADASVQIRTLALEALAQTPLEEQVCC